METKLILSESLENVVKALTSEVKAIQNELPQYEFVPEKLDVIEKCSMTVLKRFVPKRQVPQPKEYGLKSDYYIDTIKKLFKENQNFDTNQQDKKPGRQTLRDAFPNATIVMDQRLNKFKQDLLRKKNNLLNLEFTNVYWLTPVRMPDDFCNTDVVMINNLYQGLLHSFVRHSDIWLELIPGLETKSLSHIQSHLDKIKIAGNLNASGIAINGLSEALRIMMTEETIKFIDVKMALIKIQLRIHDYLKENVTSSQHLKCPIEAFFRSCFKIVDASGKIKVMNICHSEQLYPEIDGFGQPGIKKRPVRVITTVCFITEKEFDELNEVDELENITSVSGSNRSDSGYSDNDVEDGLSSDCYDVDALFFDDDDLPSVQITSPQMQEPTNKIDNEMVISQEELQKIDDKFMKNLRNDASQLKELSRKLLLPVKMRDSLEFTTAILANDPFQGLLHSLLRHWDQWVEHISELKSTMQMLACLEPEIKKIKNAPNRRRSKNAIQEWFHKLNSFNKTNYVEFALIVAQLKIHQFIQKKVLTAKFHFEKLQHNDNISLNFEMNKAELVVFVSKKTYFRIEEFADKRPVRTITTVFFKTISKLSSIQTKNFEFVLTPLTPGERENIRSNYENQRAQQNALSVRYHNVSTFSANEQIVVNGLGNRNPQDNLEGFENIFTRQFWLHVKMPDEFDHTCSIMTLNYAQGLLHSLVRHFDQWSYFINGFDALFENLKSIMTFIENIRNTDPNDRNAMREAYDLCEDNITGDIIETILRLTMFELEIKIYDYIQYNVTYAQYLHEAVNENGQIQIYFQVRIGEEDAVMSICVSRELYPRFRDFNEDRRPVRPIITVFFIHWDDYEDDLYYGNNYWVKNTWYT